MKLLHRPKYITSLINVTVPEESPEPFFVKYHYIEIYDTKILMKYALEMVKPYAL